MHFNLSMKHPASMGSGSIGVMTAAPAAAAGPIGEILTRWTLIFHGKHKRDSIREREREREEEREKGEREALSLLAPISGTGMNSCILPGTRTFHSGQHN